MIYYASQSQSSKNARHYGRGGYSSFRPGSKEGGGKGGRGGYKRSRDSIKYSSPTPKCFTLNSSTTYPITTTLQSVSGTFVPQAVTVGATDSSRTGFTVSCSRLNLSFGLTRAACVGEQSFLVRFVVMLATKGDTLSASAMFDSTGVWNPIVLPVAASAGYVVLHDDVYHLDCVPMQICALTAATNWATYRSQRYSMISLDMRNVVSTYASNAEVEPVTNLVKIFVQSSKSASTAYLLNLKSNFYFYDY